MATYDPTIYRGAARHYLVGRPPYSAELCATLVRELGLDGTGHLLDVGCGPGVVAVELAREYETVTGLDPDPDMLHEAAAHAGASGATNTHWVQARAEDIGRLPLGSLRTVTFGQSFHWTDRERVAESVFDALEPGGSIVMITHDIEQGAVPPGTGDPPIPHDDISAIIDRYLGPATRAGSGIATPQADRYEDALARTRFGRPRTVHAPGRPDLTRDIDGVISGYLSMSYCAPHLFGDRLDDFIADVGALLAARTATGRFWDWPGDTAIVIGTKPGTAPGASG